MMSLNQNKLRKISEISSSVHLTILSIGAAILVFFIASNLGVAGEVSHTSSLVAQLSNFITDRHQQQQLQHDLPQSRLNHEDVQSIQEDNSISEAFYHQQQQPMTMFSSTVRRIQQRNTKQKLLGMCEMECQKNYECEDNLRCMKEEVNDAVPGCPESGKNGMRKGFCYDPHYTESSASSISVQPTAAPVIASLSGSAWVERSKDDYPLQKCQGHCQKDDDCDEGLDCYKRVTNEFFVPGCKGIADMVGTNYCYDPDDLTLYTPQPTRAPIVTLAPVTPAPVTKAPVTAAPVTSAPVTSAPVTSAPVTKAPQTQSPVTSAPINTHSPTTAPVNEFVQASATSAPILTSPPTIGMTVPPTRQFTSAIIALTEPGNDGIPANVFPLERCQGDCDGDADCAEGLLCYFRDGYAEVPGCSGAGYENTDYCIDKRDDPAKPPVMGAFRLKMYWEYGYNWQETFREANWCMQCLNATCYGTIINLTANCIESRCDVSDIITLRPCGIENTWFEFTNIYNGTVKSLSELAASYTMLKGVKYDRFVESYNRQVARAYFQFTRAQYEYYGHEPTNRTFFTLPADLRNGAEETFNRLVAKEYFEFTRTMYDGIEQLFHLRIATTDLCLELLNSRRIEVQPCDYYSDNQKFRPGEGNFFGKRFELSPVSSDGCLTQSHHPRDYEMIYRNSCEIGRKSNTTYYNKY